MSDFEPSNTEIFPDIDSGLRELYSGKVNFSPFDHGIYRLIHIWEGYDRESRPPIQYEAPPPDKIETKKPARRKATKPAKPASNKSEVKPRAHVVREQQGPVPLISSSTSIQEAKPLPHYERPKEYDIGMTDEFLKCIQKIDAKLRGRILDAISQISRRPDEPQGDTIKPLRGELNGLWRFRIGDYRLIYRPDREQHRVALITFASRGSIYE
jgi:mRNA-degrading endonuclease RelE of RelBE toxin-antitoxin system